MKKNLTIDSIILILLGTVGILYLVYREVFNALPFEDAAILMRYVNHLAEGQGIVWNRGEPPVDGATDFLFMLLAAGLEAIGLSTEGSVQSLNVLGYLGTIVLVYLSWRKQGHPIYLSVIVACFLILGPSYVYIEAYFATPFFGFWACLLAYCSQELIKNSDSKAWAVCWGIVSLLLGLCRPEGVFLAGFMMAGLGVYLGRNRSRLAGKYFLICLLGIGSLYLIWRYLYFGHIFPNPFYKKGGGFVYPTSLWSAA